MLLRWPESNVGLDGACCVGSAHVADNVDLGSRAQDAVATSGSIATSPAHSRPGRCDRRAWSPASPAQGGLLRLAGRRPRTSWTQWDPRP